MAQRFDVIVAGVGAMGAAACYHLARRGVRVLGIEQFDIPHGKGSSHGYSRIIRLAYSEHPDYVPLLRRAYVLWQQLEAESGQKLMHITGGLYMGQAPCESVAGALRAVREHGVAHERLSRGELRKRFGQFDVPEDYEAVLDHQAGLVLPEKAVAAHAELALRRGAELHGQETLLEWQAGGSGVKVRTTRGDYEADRLVLCAGAWTSKIVRDLGVDLRVTRQVQGWVWPKRPELFALGTLPIWIMEHPDGNAHYGFPMISDCPGFKLASHARTMPADPDRLMREAIPGDEETFRTALRRFIPAADGPVLAMRICMYTNTPDLNFIIDRHPEHENVTIGCGFSGHGFKFSTVMGQVLAELAMEGKSTLPIGFLRLGRFAGKK